MEHPAKTVARLTTKEPPTDPFFVTSRLGCLLFLMVLLTIVIGTTFRYVGKLSGGTATFVGKAGPLEQSNQNPRRTTYGFTIQGEGDELHFVRVRNHGRILAYLQRMEGERNVSVRVPRGQAISLTVEETGLQIREREAPWWLLLGVALLAAALFVALLLPVSGLWEMAALQRAEVVTSEALPAGSEEEQ